MEYKKLALVTFITVLASSLVAWQVGRSIGAYRGSKGTRFCRDCDIQALLRAKSNQQPFLLLPTKNKQSKSSHLSNKNTSNPLTKSVISNIEGIIEHR